MGVRSLAAKLSLARASSRLKPTPLSLPLDLSEKSLLVLLPAVQRDLTVVKQILPDITRIFGNDFVFLLACPDTEVRSIFPSKGFRIITPTKASVNWCHLPARSLLEKLRGHNFDYIFDTNLEENLFSSRILLNFPNAIRFGNKGKLGLPYLNLEVKTRYLRDRRLIYRSILDVVASMATGPVTS